MRKIAAVALSSQSVTWYQSTRVRLRGARVRRNRARMPSKVAVQVSRVRIGRGVSCMLTGTTSVDDDQGLTTANCRSQCKAKRLKLGEARYDQLQGSDVHVRSESVARPCGPLLPRADLDLWTMRWGMRP